MTNLQMAGAGLSFPSLEIGRWSFAFLAILDLVAAGAGNRPGPRALETSRRIESELMRAVPEERHVPPGD